MKQGHLDQDRKNLQSTQAYSPQLANPEDEGFPPMPPIGVNTHTCYVALMEPTGQTYMDLTGKFVASSSSSNNYIMIIYDYNSNAILAIPLKNHKSESILATYKSRHARLCAAGLRPQLQCLDNEASHALQDYLITEAVDYQLVLPHLHRRNAAERAI